MLLLGLLKLLLKPIILTLIPEFDYFICDPIELYICEFDSGIIILEIYGFVPS